MWNSENKWYCVFTIPKHEKKVLRNLVQKGITAFLPLRKEIRQWSDRKKKVQVPLFPNYLFVNLLPKERYKIFEVPGIIRYLDSNNNPKVIQDKEIELIQKLLKGEGNIESSDQQFIEGEKVIVTSGQLKNLTGVLVGKKGARRLLIEIQSLNKNVIIDIPPFHVEKLQTQKQLVRSD